MSPDDNNLHNFDSFVEIIPFNLLSEKILFPINFTFLIFVLLPSFILIVISILFCDNFEIVVFIFAEKNPDLLYKS